jgi:hypothetical protein
VPHGVNTHRRIDFEELQRYKTELKERSGTALRPTHELDAQNRGGPLTHGGRI